MEKVYILLDWYYEGDSNLVNSFVGAYLTKEEAISIDPVSSFMQFFNPATKQTSEVYTEGCEPVEYGQYGSENKIEIREIVFEQKYKSYVDWGDGVKEAIKDDLSIPIGTNLEPMFSKEEIKKINPVIDYQSKFSNCSSFNGDLLNWDTSNISELRSLKHMNYKQQEYCFKNNLVTNYPFIGPAAMIDKENKEEFNSLK